MSILIKGMEMPKDDCEAYRQIIITNNLVDGKIQMLAHDANTNEFIGEVVELPPHGRLIDADAYEKLLRGLGNRDYRREAGTLQDAIKFLHPHYAPTIIPADGKDTNVPTSEEARDEP